MNSKSRVVIILTGAAIATSLILPAIAAGQVPESHDASVAAHSEGVRARYAQANLRLAELELRIALTENEKIRNIYSVQTVQRLRNNVAYAQEMLRHETHRGGNGLHALHLREVEGTLQLAESDLAAAVAANKQVPGSVNDLEIERLRATVDVARLALEKARDPAATQSPMDHLQWQLDRIRSELTRLYVLMDKVASRN